MRSEKKVRGDTIISIFEMTQKSGRTGFLRFDCVKSRRQFIKEAKQISIKRLNWIQSFLEERKHYADISRVKSTGVQQGSVLELM